MRENVTVILLTFFLMSCVKETMPGGPDVYRVSVECETLSGGGGPVRSSFDETALTKVSDVSIFIYRDGRLVDDLFFDEASKIQVSFPSSSCEYNVHMLANMGDMAAPEDESGLQDMKFSFDDYGRFGIRGFPMANSFLSYVPGSNQKFKLKRLVGMYRIRMENSSAVVDYRIKSVYLRNCALDVYPFGEKRATAFILEGDCLSEDDIRALNAGEDVELYFLENLQGELLPGNTDPKQKIPDNIPDASAAGRCTYIQMLAEVTTPTAHFDNVFYRVYLGENLTTDFTIRRSTLYSLSLNFATNMIADEGWRVEPEAPDVRGSICLDKPVARVIRGFDDVIFISTSSANGKAVEYDIAIDSQAATRANLTYDTFDAGDGTVGLRFSTSAPIDGLGSFDRSPDLDAEEVEVRVVSKDRFNGSPTIEEKAVVKVYHKVFPLYLKTEYERGEWILYMYSRNPLGVQFDVGYRTFAGQDCGMPVTSGSSRGWSSGTSGECLKQRVGSIGRADGYPGGLRLDLDISPVSPEGAALYMGENTSAYFGPGPYLYPAAYPEFVENHTTSVFHLHGTLTSGTTDNFYAIFKSENINFLFGDECPGWNRCNSYTMAGFNGARPCPFYFVNGDLEAYDVTRYTDNPKYLDDSARQGVEIWAYEPGRDLGIYAPSAAVFGFRVGTMIQLFGQTHRWEEWKSYDYHIYMTINGCTCWPGASSSPEGFRPGEYQQ